MHCSLTLKQAESQLKPLKLDRTGLEYDELYVTDFDIDGIPDVSSYDT